MTGKIIKGIAGFYYVHTGTTGIYTCKAKGIFRKNGVKPLVGDDVEMSVTDEKEKEGNVDRIFPRKNALLRPEVANVEQALVIFAMKKPDANLNLLDRFLVMMERQSLPTVICFNKRDIASPAEEAVLRNPYIMAGYHVVCTSTISGEGIDIVKALLRGKTTVVAGPSGVGKSSLVNCLQKDIFMETGSISKKIERGRHTTRHSELIYIEKDTYIVDTPGFSSLGLFDIKKEDLRFYYPEFSDYEGGCRFQGCTHVHEPDCIIKEAVEAGKIARNRYENYCLLYEELERTKRY